MRLTTQAIALLLLAHAARCQTVESILAEAQKRAHSTSVRYRGAVAQVPDPPAAPVPDKSWTFERLGPRGHSKTLVRFLSPGDANGVTLLILDQKDASSGRWIFTPADRRVRRLTDPEVRFSYGDIDFDALQEPDFTAFTARLLPAETLDGVACWKIELRPKPTTQSPYTLSLLWLRKDDYAIAQIDDYSGDTLSRRIVNRGLHLVQAIWTPQEVVVSQPDLHRRLTFHLDDAAYNVPLTDAEFTLPGGLPEDARPRPTAPCVFMLQPQSATVPAAGFAGIVLVSTQPGCSWTAKAGASWISIQSGTGTGAPNGAISFRVAANTALEERSSSIAIGGRSIPIRQQGAAR